MEILAYMYEADLWCVSCGEKVKKKLDAEGKAPEHPADECTYDSDDYPKPIFESWESNSPDHCVAGECCLEAETLPSGRKVGAFLNNSLTEAGYSYIIQSLADDPTSEVVAFLFDQYGVKYA